MTSLSVDKIWLPRSVNSSSNCSGWSLKMEIAPFFKTHEVCLICFLPLEPDYTVGTRLKTVNLLTVTVSILQHGCTKWTLMKLKEKMLEENCSRMLRIFFRS